jgi:hypothetical protein
LTLESYPELPAPYGLEEHELRKRGSRPQAVSTCLEYL